MKLSEKILSLRKARNMSQEELADRLGVSRQAVSRWEVGSALPDASNILQISRLFGVSADYLLNDEYKGDSPIPLKERTVSSIAGTFTRKIISLCVAGFGFICNFIIYILSRFIEVSIPHIAYVEDGMYTWNYYEDYSYRYFVEEHRLGLIVFIFWTMFIIGLFIAFMPKDRFMVFLDKAKTFIKLKLPKGKTEI